MRFVTALLSAGFILGTLLCLRRASVSTWPVAGVILAVSPVVVYSTTVVSPNGVEICAAIAVWTGLMVTLRDPGILEQRAVVTVLVTSASALALIRSLGVLWLAGAVVFAAAVTSRRWARVAGLLRVRRALIGVVVVGLAALAGVVWTLSQRSLVVGVAQGTSTLEERLAMLPEWNFLWMLQSIAAFPLRNERAPVVVYVLYGALWCAFMAYAMFRGHRKVAVLGACVTFCALAFASAVTLHTYNTYGWAWQGRYALPLSVGASVLAGWAMIGRPPPSMRVWMPALVMYVASHVVSVVNVRRMTGGAGDELLLSNPLSWATVACLAVGGAILVGAGPGCWRCPVEKLDTDDFSGLDAQPLSANSPEVS